MCELAIKREKHSMVLMKKSMIVIAMTAREREGERQREGGEKKRQVSLKIQKHLSTWVMAAGRAVQHLPF